MMVWVNVLVLTALLQNLDNVVPQRLLGCFGSLVCWNVNLCLVRGPESSLLWVSLNPEQSPCPSLLLLLQAQLGAWKRPRCYKAHQLGVAVMVVEVVLWAMERHVS